MRHGTSRWRSIAGSVIRSSTGGAAPMTESRLDFFSPLPLWAQRRLMIFGRPMPPEKCLMSYWLPSGEAKVEERFLQDRLWLSASDGASEGGSHANNP